MEMPRLDGDNALNGAQFTYELDTANTVYGCAQASDRLAISDRLSLFRKA